MNKKGINPYMMIGVHLTVIPIFVFFVMILAGVTLPDWTFGLAALISGIGIAIVVGLFLNNLKSRSDNDPIMSIVKEAIRLAYSKINRIREEQEIDLKISLDKRRGLNGVLYDFVVVKATHTFKYVNRTARPDAFLHEMFSDFRHHHDEVDEKGRKRFRFEYIHFGMDDHPREFETIMIHHGVEKANNELACTKDGKLKFSAKISVPANDKKELKYIIHNEYKLTDKLLWPFQEISKNIKLNISLMNGFNGSNSDLFTLKAYHPLENDILEKNPNAVEQNGVVKFEDSTSEINLCNIMLPYQGFELSWKLDHLRTN